MASRTLKITVSVVVLILIGAFIGFMLHLKAKFTIDRTGKDLANGAMTSEALTELSRLSGDTS